MPMDYEKGQSMFALSLKERKQKMGNQKYQLVGAYDFLIYCGYIFSCSRNVYHAEDASRGTCP